MQYQASYPPGQMGYPQQPGRSGPPVNYPPNDGGYRGGPGFSNNGGMANNNFQTRPQQGFNALPRGPGGPQQGFNLAADFPSLGATSNGGPGAMNGMGNGAIADYQNALHNGLGLARDEPEFSLEAEEFPTLGGAPRPSKPRVAQQQQVGQVGQPAQQQQQQPNQSSQQQQPPAPQA